MPQETRVATTLEIGQAVRMIGRQRALSPKGRLMRALPYGVSAAVGVCLGATGWLTTSRALVAVLGFAVALPTALVFDHLSRRGIKAALLERLGPCTEVRYILEFKQEGFSIQENGIESMIEWQSINHIAIDENDIEILTQDNTTRIGKELFPSIPALAEFGDTLHRRVQANANLI